MNYLIIFTCVVVAAVAILHFKTTEGFLKMLFGKNTYSDADRKHIAETYQPVLKSIRWLKPLTQFISGGTFAFFISSYIINNFTSLDISYSIAISAIIGIGVGFLVEGGLSVFLTPFWQSLINFKFTSRINLFLFLFVAVLVVGFGSITTIGSKLGSPELVEIVSNDSVSIDVQDVSKTMLNPIQSLITSQENSIKGIELSRSQGRVSIENKWNAKIKADENWAKKKGIKNYTSPHIAKKESELSYYDANTAKMIQSASNQNTSSIEKLTDNATSTLFTVSELQKNEVQEQKERKGSYSFIVMCIAIFATIATFLLTGIREMILFGGGKYIKTDKADNNSSILDEPDDSITPTDDSTDDKEKQRITKYVQSYVSKYVKPLSDGFVINEKGKDLFSKWMHRGHTDRTSDDWKKFVEVKKQLSKLGIETTVHKTRCQFFYKKVQL